MRFMTSRMASHVIPVVFWVGVMILPCSINAETMMSHLIIGGFDATSKTKRVQIGRDVLLEVEKISKFLPTPPPSDQAWLREEALAIRKLGSSDAAVSRHQQLVKTQEFQHQELFKALLAIKDALHCVLDESTPLHKEIMCWAVASLMLTDSDMLNDSISILLKSGRLPKDIHNHVMLGSKDLGHSYIWVFAGRGMHKYIVIPYLRGELNQ